MSEQRAPADLALPGPGVAQLRGVAAREVWLTFDAPSETLAAPRQPTTVHYDAVLDLASGCVTETYQDWFHEVSELSKASEPLDEPLSAAKFREALGHFLAFEDRFEVLVLGAPSRNRSFGGMGYTTDKHFIALTQSRGVYLSRDGGLTFALLAPGATLVTFFEDRFLVAALTHDAQPNGAQDFQRRARRCVGGTVSSPSASLPISTACSRNSSESIRLPSVASTKQGVATALSVAAEPPIRQLLAVRVGRSLSALGTAARLTVGCVSYYAESKVIPCPLRCAPCLSSSLKT